MKRRDFLKSAAVVAGASMLPLELLAVEDRRKEILIVASGQGEIYCDNKTTPVGPGAIMYTSPNAKHGIKNTGKDPLVFYWVKWIGVSR